MTAGTSCRRLAASHIASSSRTGMARVSADLASPCFEILRLARLPARQPRNRSKGSRAQKPMKAMTRDDRIAGRILPHVERG